MNKQSQAFYKLIYLENLCFYCETSSIGLKNLVYMIYTFTNLKLLKPVS